MNEIPFCIIKSEENVKHTEKHLSYRCSGTPEGFAGLREVKIFPPGKEIVIKELREQNSGSCIVSLKGIGAKAVRQGAVILPLWACGETAEGLYGFLVNLKGKRLRSIPGDIPSDAFLTSPGFPPVPGTGKRSVRVKVTEGGLRLVAGEKVLVCPGAEYRIGAEEESDNLRFIPIVSGRFSPGHEKRILSEIGRLPDVPKRLDVWKLRLSARGYSAVPPDIESALRKSGGESAVRFFGVYAVKESYLGELRNRIMKAVTSGEDVSIGDLADSLDIDRGLVKEISASLIAEGGARKEGGIIIPNRPKETGLSPAVRRFRDILEKRGEHGIDLREPNERASRPFAETLEKRKEALFLDENFVISMNAYRALAAILSLGKKPGDAVRVQETRDKLEIPRRALPALLNRMEADGILERDGDIRRISRKKGGGRSGNDGHGGRRI